MVRPAVIVSLVFSIPEGSNVEFDQAVRVIVFYEGVTAGIMSLGSSKCMIICPHQIGHLMHVVT
jgi:hypothetical protein